MRRYFCLWIVLGWIALAASAQEPTKTSIAVYQIKPAGADPSLAQAMSSLLGSRLTPSPKLKVTEEAYLKTVMARQGLNASDACDDTSCQVEIGKLVKAQKLVIGDLTKFGSTYILSLKVVDIQSGVSEFTTDDRCACGEDQLPDLVEVAAAKIRNHFGENMPVPALPQTVAATATAPAQTGRAAVAAVPGKKVVATVPGQKSVAPPEVVDTFFTAAKNGDFQVIQELFNNYMGLVNARYKGDVYDKYGDIANKEYTPLHFAAYNGSQPICQLLLDNGADVNAKAAYAYGVIPKYGRTPLCAAALGGSKAVVELLVAKGAEVNVECGKPFSSFKQTFSPLDFALHGKHQDVADFLIQHGAKKNKL